MEQEPARSQPDAEDSKRPRLGAAFLVAALVACVGVVGCVVLRLTWLESLPPVEEFRWFRLLARFLEVFALAAIALAFVARYAFGVERRFKAAATVVMWFGVLAALYGAPGILNGEPRNSVRSKVSRARSDMAQIARAIEAYRTEHGTYPACTFDPAEQVAFAPGVALPTFRTYRPGAAASLTTPVAYLRQMPVPDCFASRPGGNYAYWAPEDGAWCILISPGPDRSFDIDRQMLPTLLGMPGPSPSPELIRLTYDPSNGTVSRGDIWAFR